MSYRIRVRNAKGKDLQLFGNNEYPEEFIREIKKQGAVIDNDGCFRNFQVKEIRPIINSVEKYIKDAQKSWESSQDYAWEITQYRNERHDQKSVKSNSIFDFTNNVLPLNIHPNPKYKTGYDEAPIWFIMSSMIEDSLAFASLQLIYHINSSLERVSAYEYRLKRGEKIIIEGY